MRKVVATSGGFDPLHGGHLAYFLAAKKLAGPEGKHIVILNSDSFLLRKKGYVFLPLEDRLAFISQLKCVDAVYLCETNDQTVIPALKALKPTIFAKGGDRNKPSMIPEWEICKQLKIKVAFNVGGGKIASSQDLVQKVFETILLQKSASLLQRREN